MIEIKNLTVCYEEKVAVDDISLHIKKGKITAIIGPNGCGKSTMIKAISGFFKDSKKSIVVDDKQRDQYVRKEFARKVSFLMQFSDVPVGMTVKELVSYGRLPHRKMFESMKEDDYKQVDWALHKTSIYDSKDKMVSQLSGGERQRAFFALTLAQKTEVLILDEPTNHLDLKYQHDVMQLINKLNKEENLTIICVLHDVNQALRYSDEIVVMKDGTIVTQGKPKECITKEIMHNVYGVECDIQEIGNYHNVFVL